MNSNLDVESKDYFGGVSGIRDRLNTENCFYVLVVFSEKLMILRKSLFIC
jgi:hypothetical protein